MKDKHKRERVAKETEETEAQKQMARETEEAEAWDVEEAMRVMDVEKTEEEKR